MKAYNGFSPKLRLESLAWIKEQYALGKLNKPAQCCACGQTAGIIDWHAEDYSKPFGDHLLKFPLCYVCHMIIHCTLNDPERFKMYHEAIMSGYRFNAYYSRDFDRFKNEFLTGGLPHLNTCNDKPKRDAFAEILAERKAVLEKDKRDYEKQTEKI